MDAALAEIADAYMRWVADGDPSIEEVFASPRFARDTAGWG